MAVDAKIPMTEEQFNLIRGLSSEKYNLTLYLEYTENSSWYFPSTKCLNHLSPLAFAVAWHTPEKIQIVGAR